ncbi:hypothetical protein IP92_02648 [Pseudoduganella flava]|uniref:Uncharacterized protein n=1 Tax=Pseudoduganella flava TaxID=871742 RepID=A0A562PT67_9BURK|nr:hypothetical protein [Pseudoduganella flava]QGZ39126.1 hypothetical protein GO485_08770 [Pseudoduganella flava]TWI47588.1 hypothetical protein IP92_02648 [Pseudoduganella flava]
MNAMQQHTELVQASLLRLDGDRQTMLSSWKAVIGGNGAPMFPLDLLASGAVKRALSASAAMKLLIESWNMVSARSLLRTHLDTSLRFSAAWLVKNPHEFATLAISGKPINKLKDREGERLTDARLVQIRSKDYTWLPAVYDNLCGYVHFSSSHLYDAVESLYEDGTINLLISETDLNFPESSWLEVIECFREGSAMLVKFLNGYAITKRLTREQLEEGRRHI